MHVNPILIILNFVFTYYVVEVFNSILPTTMAQGAPTEALVAITKTPESGPDTYVNGG